MSITAGLNVFGANRDIASEINKAAATGNYVLAAQLEVERNRKVAEMDGGGLNNYNYFQTQEFQQPQQPIPQPIPQPQQTESDLFALQEKRRLQALEASRRNALSSLGAERGQINPTYNTALSNVAGQSALGARTLAEFINQRGLGTSGAAVQGEVMRQGSLQNNITSLEADRANWMADIGRRETLANSAYDEGSLQASMQRVESELESKLRMMEQQRTESIGTVGQYGQDYAAEINRIEAEIARGDNSRAYLLPYLRIARQDKVAGIAKSQAEQEQEEWDRWIATQRLGGSGGGSGGGGSSSVTTTKPTLTAAQARSAYENGVYTDTVLDAYSFHYGVPITMLGNYQEVERILNQRFTPSSQVSLIEQYNMTGKLSDAQAMELLKKYGLVR